MKEILKIISQDLADHNINLKEPLNSFIEFKIPNSMTNQFMVVTDIMKQKILIRLNGKLWPPFSRETEHSNLIDLEKNGIKTQVISNNPKVGYQICSLLDENEKLDQLLKEEKQGDVFTDIGKEIRKIHQINHFSGQYMMAMTVNNSFQRLAIQKQQTWYVYYTIILSIIITIHADQENQVPSHNDLLPSSIYVKRNRVRFVDWEYSGLNHRTYDLSLLSIKSDCTSTEEQKLMMAYDPSNRYDMEYYMPLMKATISFLLLLWAQPAKNSLVDQSSILLDSLKLNLQTAIFQQSAREIFLSSRLSFFKCHLHVKDIAEKKSETVNQFKLS